MSFVGALGSTADLVQMWQCESCDKTFMSKQACAAHAFRKHVRSIRAFVNESATCFACLLEFSTRSRRMDHIADKSPICMDFLTSNFIPIDPETVALLDVEDRSVNKLARSKGMKRGGVGPCLRLPGPSLIGRPNADGTDGAIARSVVRHPLGPNRRYCRGSDVFSL